MTTLRKPRTPVEGNQPLAPFEPHPWFRGGNAQTIAGRYLPGRRLSLPSTYHEIDADLGDRLSILESIPAGWRPGDPQALMIHGLAGCARATYVVRVAIRLMGIGVRVVRMNLRGAGAGFGSARGVYHAGRTGDVRQVAEWMARLVRPTRRSPWSDSRWERTSSSSSPPRPRNNPLTASMPSWRPTLHSIWPPAAATSSAPRTGCTTATSSGCSTTK